MALAFAIVAVLAAALMAALVIVPLLRSSGSDDADIRPETNIEIYRSQLAELEADHAAGKVLDAEYEESRAEIERRVLEEANAAEGHARGDSTRLARWTAAACAVLIPVLTAGLYCLWGSPQKAFDPEAYIMQAHNGGEETMGAQTMEAAIEELKGELAKNPENGRGWLMLARASTEIGNYKQACDAYDKATKQLGESAEVLADWADALAMVNGRSIAGAPEKLINRALELEPTQWKALAMAGTLSFDKKDYKKAVEYWDRLVKNIPAESEFATRIRDSIDEACYLGNLPRRPRPDKKDANDAPQMPQAGSSGTDSVSGVVAVSDEVRAKFKPNDAVYIFAMQMSGSRMPVSFTKVKVSDLPYHFTLSDMSGQMGREGSKALKDLGKVVVMARISRSGDFMPGEGDWQGKAAAPVEVGKGECRVDITEPWMPMGKAAAAAPSKAPAAAAQSKDASAK